MNGNLPPERVPAHVLAWSETEMERRAGETDAEKRPVLALWRPKGLSVAIGVGQSAERDVDPEAIRRDGAALLRRASGGGAVVLCEGVLCWEAWADVEALRRAPGPANDGGIRAAYAALSLPVMTALRALGIDAFHAGVCDIAANASTGGGGGPPRKLAGTAQLRRRRGVLVHGSLLVHADLALLPRYLPAPAVAPEYRAGREHGAFCATVRSLAPHIPDTDTMRAVAAAAEDAAAALGWELRAPPEELPPEAEHIVRGKYLSPDWNWRKIR